MLIADTERVLEELLVKRNETNYQLQEYRKFCHPQEENPNIPVIHCRFH